jgi:FKBP-type peptidyl-prolyl cis-trans isomerase
LSRAQAAQAKNYELALSKVDQVIAQAGVWRQALEDAKRAADSPPEPQAAPEPPEESVPFSMNTTHLPTKCPRKSVEGATMRVHYVGKLLATGKIFATSFHTGSQPFRFTLGSDEVVAGWNEGLHDMCEGERRRLMVPWDMAYGSTGGKGVPPFSDLQYDLELVELSVPKIPKPRGGKKTEL